MSEVGDAIRQLWQENPHLDYARMEGLALQIDDLWRRAQEHRHCGERMVLLTGPPELQIHISHEALKRAADVLAQDPYITEPEKIAGLAIAAALAEPPTVTEHTVETLVRALLATYPDHRWDGIKLREMVEGLLLSLGVEVKS